MRRLGVHAVRMARVQSAGGVKKAVTITWQTRAVFVRHSGLMNNEKAQSNLPGDVAKVEDKSMMAKGKTRAGRVTAPTPDSA
jgi:hypothetical protein